MKTVHFETGNGNSVLQIVRLFQKANGRTVKYEIVRRRE
jgi:UDP-glucose 4-epimerase